MGRVPRHEFVSERMRDLAYEDFPLPIDEGQTISQPYIVAFMTQAIEPQRKQRVLEVGTGSGYQAAVLAELVDEVYTVELLPGLARQARARLDRLGYRNIRLRTGDGYLGWPEAAPFDAILVTCGADHVPKPLFTQLKRGGKLVIPVGPASRTQWLRVITKGPKDERQERDLIPVRFVPLRRASEIPPERPPLQPLQRTVDLNVGESQQIELADGKKATVKLLDLQETRDDLRQAVRRAEVKVEVNGAIVKLVSANYRLPVTIAGVQIDCPVTRGYRQEKVKGVSRENPWALDRDVRLRLWPAGSPWMKPGSFMYPARQCWFASDTQMANDPVYVDGGESALVRNIYYHYGLDIGGGEGLVEVVAATDGLVISSGKELLPGYDDTPVRPRYDVVYLLGPHDWYNRYSHLYTIDPAIKPGARIKMGQRIGLLGKEGGSGGWSHLHFDISGKQPSGKWGIIEGYAFLWEAYLHEFQPQLLAVARPHHLAAIGQKVTLDGSRSWSSDGKISSYAWNFTDGQRATGALVQRSYARPGVYSEVLKITDAAGRVDYDFAVVHVLDSQRPKDLPPSIHPVYSPTFGIKPGDPVTFLVRTFRTTDGQETWDFGDGSPKVQVKSDGNVVPLAKDGYARTVHRYAKAGHYLVRVERTNRHGFTAIGHLHVRVGTD
jgi:protein-L-isoaspartate(D-aspartate) O-methyltransferase